MAALMSSRWLLPEGLMVGSMRREAGGIAAAACSAAGDAACPACGTRSRRVHSRYLRTLVDLPCSGRVRGSASPPPFPLHRAACPRGSR